MNNSSFIIAILVGSLLSSLIIWLTGTLNLGLEVHGLRAAFKAALVITIVNGLSTWLCRLFGLNANFELHHIVLHLLITVVILFIAGNFIKGLRVKDFTGLLVAAIAITAVTWLIT